MIMSEPPVVEGRRGQPAIALATIAGAVSADADRRAESGLLERIRQGDERAVEVLYLRYRGPLFAAALRRTRSVQLADEVVQDTFTAVWRTASGFDTERGTLSSWLFGLVRNKSVDALRREGDDLRTLPEEALEPQRAPDATDEDAWARIRAAHVHAAVAALPEPQRVAVELAFFAGLPQAEVADRLGIPLGTAKKRIRSGLLRLRVQLAAAVTADPDGCPILA
jgi:RNA polymerase sigma-70 factor, ECF subfamily